MNENDKPRVTSISQASPLEEIGDFWDTPSLDEYWDQTHEVVSTIRAQRRQRITLDPDPYKRLEAQARARGIRPETLANLWLDEQLQKLG